MVLRRDAVAVLPRDLYVIAMDAVETDFQAAEACALPLALFQFAQERARLAAQFAQFVQFLIEAVGDHAAVPDGDGGRFHQRACKKGLQRRESADHLVQFMDAGAVDGVQGGFQRGQSGQGFMQLAQIPGARGLQGRSGQDPLQVVDRLQGLGDFRVGLVAQQALHRVVAQPEGLLRADGAVDPAFQQPAPHGGGGGVQHPQQAVLFPARQVLIQFQIVAAGGVQDDAVRRVFHLDGAQVQQGGALRLVNILQQGPRGAGGEGQFGATQPFQLADLILLLDKAGRRVSLETPCGAGHDVLAQVAAGLFHARVFGDQEFDGPQAMQLVHHGSEAFGLGEGEAAIGEVEAGDALLRGAGVDADQQVVGPGFQ